jgi:YfiH family protein
MKRIEKDGIEWLEFELFQEIPWIRHGSLTRHGGVSEGVFNSLNVGYDIGDPAENVTENLRRAAEALGIEQKIIFGNQQHGIEVVRITSKPSASIDYTLPECDGFITNLARIPIMIKHADCQAALFIDPINRAIGAAHAGWRGSVQNIYKSVVHKMANAFGSKAENLLIAISPSLGPNASEFIHYKKELPEAFWEFQIKPNYFDFWAISLDQLKALGIRSDHIQVAELCTFNDPIDFFSYRRQNKIGRHGTIIQLN